MKADAAMEDAAKAGILKHSDRDGQTLKPILKLLLAHWDGLPLGFRQVLRETDLSGANARDLYHCQAVSGGDIL